LLSLDEVGEVCRRQAASPEPVRLEQGEVAMKNFWLMGFGVVLGLQVLDPASGFGGHGHARGSHAAKASHEAPKHSNGKPAAHPAPKPSPKAPAKPQLKSPPKPPGKPKDAHPHKPDLGKPSPHHESNHTRPNAVGSSSKAQEQAAKDDKTHHDSQHHHEHHGWHHDRWWHGHHHIWSEEGYWVDATTGLPVVAADAAVPADGSDGVVAASPSAGVAGRPRIHFSVDPSERETYDAAAQAAGTSRAEWIRSRLNAAVHQELE
jgi:hypothetical protein